MARQQARRRHRERLTGITLAGLGVAVLVVAGIALASPRGNQQTAASASSGAATSTPAKTSVAPSASSSVPSPASRSTSKPAGSSSSSATSTTATAAAQKLPLVVLNNSNISGLANSAARTFRNGGWEVTSVSNLNDQIISTCAYYDPSVSGAEAAARALRNQFPSIKRVVQKFSSLPNGPIVVVLTSDYSTG